MPEEIELKFRIADPAALRRRLREVGAQPEGAVLEVNTLFDTPPGSLLAADCGLRLRTCRAAGSDGAAENETANPSGGLLTYKGPRRAGATKVRMEWETAVANLAAMRQILNGLGYREVLVFEKRRETYTVAGCDVTLDELPQLGWFSEIEGPTAEAVDAVRTLLGLKDAATCRETYIELVAAAGLSPLRF